MAKLKFDIQQDEKTKPISFKLYKHEIELIETYTNYLSYKHNSDVKKEVVLRGLLKPLSKDKDYLDYLAKHQRAGAEISKKQSEKESKIASQLNQTEITSP